MKDAPMIEIEEGAAEGKTAFTIHVYACSLAVAA